MKLLIDNALSPIVARELQAAGHEAVHVRDLGLQNATDREILRVAEQHGRVVVSADTDFGTLLTLREQSTPSFVLLRRQKGPAPSRVASVLLDALRSTELELRSGAVVVITDERIRIRTLPVRRQE